MQTSGKTKISISDEGTSQAGLRWLGKHDVQNQQMFVIIISTTSKAMKPAFLLGQVHRASPLQTKKQHIFPAAKSFKL